MHNSYAYLAFCLEVTLNVFVVTHMQLHFIASVIYNKVKVDLPFMLY